MARYVLVELSNDADFKEAENLANEIILNVEFDIIIEAHLAESDGFGRIVSRLDKWQEWEK